MSASRERSAVPLSGSGVDRERSLPRLPGAVVFTHGRAGLLFVHPIAMTTAYVLEKLIEILTLLSAIAATVLAILNRTAVNRVKSETARNGNEIQKVGIATDAVTVAVEQVRHATNSMKDQLVAATDAAADAKGYKRRDDEAIATKKADGEGYQRAQDEHFQPYHPDMLGTPDIPPYKTPDVPPEPQQGRSSDRDIEGPE